MRKRPIYVAISYLRGYTTDKDLLAIGTDVAQVARWCKDEHKMRDGSRSIGLYKYDDGYNPGAGSCLCVEYWPSSYGESRPVPDYEATRRVRDHVESRARKKNKTADTGHGVLELAIPPAAES